MVRPFQIFAKSFRSISLLMIIALIVSLTGSQIFAQSSHGNPKHGKILFDENCMECHGRNGDGSGPIGYFLAIRPADFLAVESRIKSDAELFTIIKKGIRFDEMHGWEELLSAQNIHDVISYIRTLAPPLPQRE